MVNYECRDLRPFLDTRGSYFLFYIMDMVSYVWDLPHIGFVDANLHMTGHTFIT